jgi:hypothetical protein
LFAAYYLQAAAISVNIGKIDVGKFLGHLNPDRPFLESYHNAALECLVDVPLAPYEDYRFGLPGKAPRLGLESLPVYANHALEAIEPDLQDAIDDAKKFQHDATAGLAQGYHKRKRQFDEAATGRFNSSPRAYEPDPNDPEMQAKPFEPKPYTPDKKLSEAENAAKQAEWDAKQADPATKAAHDQAEKDRIYAYDKKRREAHDRSEQQRHQTAQGFGTDLSKDMREAANLSVGRMYTVNITDGGHSAQIPVLIRLLTTVCDPGLLVHILSDGAKVKSSTGRERWFGFKMKELKFWRDIIAATDLIDEHKKALLKDDNGVYAHILKRRRAGSANNAHALATGGEFSVGTASNLVITTRQSIKELEAEIGGKFDNFDVRQKVFSRSYLMIVVVIDPDYDHVTFYYRDIETPTELTVRDLKKASKEGADVLEILKTFQQGNAPRF